MANVFSIPISNTLVTLLYSKRIFQMVSIVHTRTMLTRFCGELLQTYVKFLKVKDDNCFAENSFL